MREIQQYAFNILKQVAILKDIFHKQGGFKLIKDWLRAGIFPYAVVQVFLLGRRAKLQYYFEICNAELSGYLLHSWYNYL